jgi:hypothetical protein
MVVPARRAGAWRVNSLESCGNYAGTPASNGKTASNAKGGKALRCGATRKKLQLMDLCFSSTLGCGTWELKKDGRETDFFLAITRKASILGGEGEEQCQVWLGLPSALRSLVPAGRGSQPSI